MIAEKKVTRTVSVNDDDKLPLQDVMRSVLILEILAKIDRQFFLDLFLEYTIAVRNVIISASI